MWTKRTVAGCDEDYRKDGPKDHSLTPSGSGKESRGFPFSTVRLQTSRSKGFRRPHLALQQHLTFSRLHGGLDSPDFREDVEGFTVSK